MRVLNLFSVSIYLQINSTRKYWFKRESGRSDESISRRTNQTPVYILSRDRPEMDHNAFDLCFHCERP